MRQRILFALFAAITTLLATASCIRDNIGLTGGDPEGPDDGYATLVFDPRFAEPATRVEWWGDDAIDPDDPFPAGNEADSNISTFRVLVYDRSTGALVAPSAGKAWNFLFDTSVQTPPFRVRIPASATAYNFVFIANEQTPDYDDTADTPSTTPKFGETGSTGAAWDTFAELAAYRLEYANDIAGHLDIPMFTVIENVKVAGSKSITINGKTEDVSDGWSVDMLRTSIRLSILTHFEADKLAAWKRFHAGDTYPYITVGGLRNKGWMTILTGSTPQYNDALGASLTRRIPVLTAAQLTSAGSQISSMTEAQLAASPDLQSIARGEYGLFTGDGSTVRIDRLIYPELMFSSSGDSSRSLEMSVDFEFNNSVETKTALIHRQPEDEGDPVDYTMPRNTWLLVGADVENDITLVTKVLPWNNADLGDVIGDIYHLTTDPSVVVFPASGGNRTIEVTTDHPSGWTVDLSGMPSWIESVTPTSGSTGTASLEIEAGQNPSGTLEKWSFDLVAGNLTRKITVISFPGDGTVSADPPPANVIMYVGAFWRAEQYGERLIRIPRPTAGTAAENAAIDGEWAAVVIEGEDWIVIDKEMTRDPNVGWRTDLPSTPDESNVKNGNDNGFDVQYRVNTTEIMTDGRVSEEVPQIYFRVGLTGTYTPTAEAPARYGVVLLAYTNGGVIKFHKIYIRQGEEPDYLMYPDDASGNGVLASRPVTQKFSPYNLTAAEYMGSGIDRNSALDRVDVRPGGAPSTAVFTDYPSQAGAYFLSANARTAEVYAFSPLANLKTSPFGHPTYYDWNSTWLADDREPEHPTGTVRDNHESCPPGYRRPSEGNDAAFVSNPSIGQSEILQSLFYSPVDTKTQNGGLDNSAFGFYADGFFDRRLADSSPNATWSDYYYFASPNRSNVAMMGRVFYNPEHNNSIFFPFTGYMHGEVGQGFVDFGVRGQYHTSSQDNNISAWGLHLSRGLHDSDTGRFGIPISSPNPIRCVKSVIATYLDVTPPSHTFDWDAKTTGASAVFTVTSDGAWTASVSGTNAANFTVVSARTGAGDSYDGTITVTPNTDNSITAERGITITVSATDATASAAAPKTVFVTQERKPVAGVRNVGTADGVIGYIHHPGFPDHHKLTMEKDDDGDDTNGIIYVAYFKFGSLVATSSQDYGTFTYADIVAWPSEWKSTTDNRAELKAAITGTNTTAWTPVPKVALTARGQELLVDGETQGKVDPAMATGDPCIYWADKNGWGDGWRLPTARENVAFVGRAADAAWNNGNSFTIPMAGHWNLDGSHAGTATDPHRAGFPVEANSGRQQHSEVLPAAGRRDDKSKAMFPGQVGYYWSSTANDASTGYYLNFDNTTGILPVRGFAFDQALAVRCVQPVVATRLDVTPSSHTFEWNAHDNGSSAVFTVSADGPWTASVSGANASDFTVAPSGTNGDGTITVTANSDNASAVEREITITVTATGAPTTGDTAPKTITVTQWVTGILAPPGVIGYIKGTNTLTIRGSKEYLRTPVMTDPGNADITSSTAIVTGKTLENETVYVAHFKFGSLVALGTENSVSAYDPSDIVAAPKGYAGANGSAATALSMIRASASTWNTIPHRVITSTIPGDGWISEPEKGLGNPCAYYTDEFGEGWKLPTGGTPGWNPEEGNPFGTKNGEWTDISGGNGPGATWIPVGTNGMPSAGAVGGDGAGGKDWSAFLPAARSRGTTGGELETEGGRYWASNSFSNSGGMGAALVVQRIRSAGNPLVAPVSPVLASSYRQAYAVRCVPPPPVAPTHLVFDTYGYATPANITGHNQGAINNIIAGMRRALVKKTANGEVTIAYLDNNDSNRFEDGTAADLTGAQGDVMVYKPEFWYKYVPASAIGANKFGYDLSISVPADVSNWIHSPASLIGAYESYIDGGKMRSRSGAAPSVSVSQVDNISSATARGTGYNIIDFEQHNMIALLFYAKYGDRHSQVILGKGNAVASTQTGSTNGNGNGSSAGVTTGHVSFAGIEGVYGGAYEWVGGVTINNGIWSITNPDGNTRTGTAAEDRGWITDVAASTGPYFDLIPTTTDASIYANETMYWTDYFYPVDSGARVLARSYAGNSGLGGVSFIHAANAPTDTSLDIASRLSFRGTIRKAASSTIFKAITPLN